MKTLAELVVPHEESGWLEIEQKIDTGKTNNVEIIPPIDDIQREEALLELQVSTRSYLGGIVYNTGGLLVDYGWIRVLGCGGADKSGPDTLRESVVLQRGILQWNRTTCKIIESLGGPDPKKYILVGDDVLGGLFAFNKGSLGTDVGKIYYFAPDSLKWEQTGKNYSEWLEWVLEGDLHTFYSTCRWPGWEDEVTALKGDEGILVEPHLYTIEGKDITKSTRKVVPFIDIYTAYMTTDAAAVTNK